MSQHPSTPKTSRRFDELEAYRGFAAIGILTFHAYQYSGQALNAYTAAPDASLFQRLFSGLHLSGVFFVLSAFLLFLPFARAALNQDGAPSARSFLIKRLIRLLPLYYFVLLVVWAWRFVGQPEQITDLLLHLTFTQTFHPTYIFWTIGPAWSLAVEMHFYLLLAGLGPLIYKLCGTLATVRGRATFIAILLGALALQSILYKLWAFTNPAISPSDYPVFYSLPAKLDALALGMLLALVVAVRGDRRLFGSWVAWLLRLAGLALIGSAILMDTVSPVVHLYYTTMVGFGTTLLIASTTLGPRGSSWEKAFCLPLPRFLGSISYGIFLLHEPLMIELGRAGLLIGAGAEAFATNVLFLILISVGAATLTHHLVEQPFNELRHLFDRSGQRVERYTGDPAPAVALPKRQILRAPRIGIGRRGAEAR